MNEQQITIDRHTYRGGGIEIDHEGTCTWENCGRYLAQILGAGEDQQSAASHPCGEPWGE